MAFVTYVLPEHLFHEMLSYMCQYSNYFGIIGIFRLHTIY